MDLLLDGGLNLNDPLTIGDKESSIAINADFRQDGIVRSRDGRNRVYSRTRNRPYGKCRWFILLSRF